MEKGTPARDATRPLVTDTPRDFSELEAEVSPRWSPRVHRRGARAKFMAGLSGLKYALRGDSSFFAHAYRGTLIALTAALLGVSPLGWTFLVIAACLVLMSELTHSAINALASALGEPDDPRLIITREIATAIVVVAAFASGAITITVLVLKLGDQLGWWGMGVDHTP
jgi:diacylglycerol kinase